MESLTASKLLEQYLSSEHQFEVDDLFKKLIKVIHNQNKELMFYKNLEINLKKSNFNHEEEFKQTDEPLNLRCAYALADQISGAIRTDRLYFITITFDPHRFDNLELTTEISQKRYIIKQLYEVRHIIGFIYGCFEKHKSGIIHSHLIMETSDEEKVYETLQRAFSSKPNNKHAVDISPVRDIKNTLRYINTDIDRDGKSDKQKHKYGFYLLKNDIFYNPKLL